MTNIHGPQRWVAHVDLDAFFASCEQRDHPEYRARPVVVGALPGHRGVVAAASYEARRFGIQSAMPVAEAYRRCPDAVFLRPDLEKYRRVSRQVFRVLESVTPIVEAASIDEAYLDVSGLEGLMGTPETIGRELKQRIQAETGLTVSVGIGPNRLVAKLGSEHRKPRGLTVVHPSQVLDFLASMPVTNLRGLGRRTRKVFEGLGIDTVAQLRTVPVRRLEEQLGRRAAAGFHRQSMGLASAEVVPGRERKSISKERTFDVDLRDQTFLHDSLREMAGEVARTARREGLAGSVVTLKVRFAGFDTRTRQLQRSTPTNDERDLLKTAWRLFLTGDLPDKPVRLIGVGLSGWDKDRPIQADLFEPPERREASQRLLATVDAVCEKFGTGMLQVGLSRKTDH